MHQDAPQEIGRILDRPPALAEQVMQGDTRMTRRWRHGALHDHLPGMSGHVVMTYYGDAQNIAWRDGGRKIVSRTKPGSITLIPHGHDGHWDIGGPIEVSHVYLSDERLQTCADLISRGKRVEPTDRVGFEEPIASRLMELLSREADAADPSSRLFVEQAIDLLCTQLVRHHASTTALPVQEVRRGLADWQVKRVTAYMVEHLDTHIGLEELSALVNLSRFHFCTAFRLATGKTPHECLTSLRLKRARQLLAQRDISILEIAISVGYQTSSSFSTCFRKVTGLTPSEYRRSL